MRFSKGSFSRAYRTCRFQESFIDGKNIVFTKDGIASRPGISLLDEPLVFEPQEFSSGYSEFNLTDTWVNIGNLKKRIAVCIEDDGYSNIYYHIFALSADSKESLGTVIFSRADAYTFGVPASFIIFDATPTIGCGIYFMARVVFENEPDTFRLCELSSNKKDWIRLSSDELYVPTLLINGRGYAAAKAINEGIKLSAPREPESLNMLGERYRASFTTDGYSFFFTMPKYPLKGKIECELALDSGSVVNFVINDGETFSQTVEVYGEAIRLRCNREAGQIVTDREKELCVPLPFYGLENNLRFTVSVDRFESTQRVSSLTKCRQIFADSASSTGRAIAFSGSSLYPEDVVWISPLCPLYFPEKNRLSVSSRVLGLDFMDGKLIVSEKDTLSSFTAAVMSPVINGVQNPINLTPSDRFEFNRSIIPETLLIGGGKLRFCTTNGEIYSVNASLKTEKVVTLPSFLPEKGAFFENKYLLIKDRELYVLDTESPEKGRLVFWELPLEILSAIDFEGKTIFYSKDENCKIFAFSLSGDSDFFSLEDDSSLPIECSFSALICEEPEGCKLHEISVAAENCDDFEADFMSNDRRLVTLPFKNGNKKVCFSAVFGPLWATFSFSGSAVFYKADLKYSKFTKL